MMKPKDDLRKDFRLMEFNGLKLRYSNIFGVPLNEECGLIEWVHNLETFRGIVKHLHKLNGQGMENRELKKYDSHHNDPIESKREKFTKYLLPRHPPVFYQWFINSFHTPQSWYQAKTAYIRTLAVMSSVGFILGLGDRHGENILLDKSSGHAVHVDFNCLFNLGETYQYAEKVPFRLTHSMVHAMGPLGVESGFRKCCELTMSVLRNEMPVLMSVLRPFVYDPLVTWNKAGNTNPNAERTDSKAMANLKRIEERLEGYVKVKGKSSNIPLSVAGQVNYIIKEATDVDNLACMFIGWGSYL
uniref:Uncharacterized protein n=1 Tax=Megaselia scalaris TaxID=36166 RepID=T1GN37_MEGSC